MAFPVGWTKKVKLTIDHTKVSGSANLSNFPVLLTEANFPAGAFDNSQGKEIYTNHLYADANLQGYWRLEADGTDETANNNDLSGTGTPTHVAGMFGNGVDLEGSTPQYYSIADASQTGLDITGDISASAWIKVESTGFRPIISKWDTNSQRPYRMAYNSGVIAVDFSDNGSSTATGHYQRYDSPAAISLGVWYHVAFSFDISAESCTIYINGSAVTTTKGSGTTIGATLHNGTAPFAIGEDFSSGSSGNDFDGIIDDVAIWNRALTDAEVLGLYTGGQDLRFSSDEAGTTQLAHEVVTWDTTNDKAQVWVKIPTVDYDDDTTFYVWYGNSDATAYAETDTYGARNVWSNGYDIVLHMEDKDAVNDSTANQYDFTKVGTPENETGKIGGSVTFDGSTDVYYRYISDSANVNGTGSFTFSCWLNTNAYTAWQKIYTHGYDSNTKALDPMVMNTSKIAGECYNLSNNPATTTSVANNTWYYFTYAYDSVNNVQVVRFNATEEDNNSTAGTTRVSLANTGHGGGNTPIAIGAVWFSNAWFSQRFNGEIDEVHFANDVFRTADWTATEYANQSSPATFVTEGTETWGSTTTSTTTSTSTSSSSTSSSSSSSTTTVAGTTNSTSSSSSTSTSTSTSSSSSSSTSSSSTTTEQVEDYSRGDYAILGTDDTDLENLFTWTEYQNVATNNGVRVAQTATNEFAEFLFKNKNDNTTDSIQVTWDGQSSAAPSSSTVYLQIYNRTTEEWETKDSDSTTGADTDFELTFTITVNLNNYYDGSGWVACRVYQEGV